VLPLLSWPVAGIASKRWPATSRRRAVPQWSLTPTSPTRHNLTQPSGRPVEHFGRLNTLVNNAGLMLLGPVVGADRDDWNRMIGVNIQGMLSVTHAALPHLLRAAEDSPRRVADIVNISSIAGRARRPLIG
jgi:NAD(P)-dependent dehydrogenase (short-subunit alcohol dehydrogenase family)